MRLDAFRSEYKPVEGTSEGYVTVTAGHGDTSWHASLRLGRDTAT